MDVESPANSDRPSSPEGLIFVSDASAEAERLTQALRSRGYPVVDVPLSLLQSRVAVQRPALILCDADAQSALDVTRDLRDIPGGAGIDLVFLGEPGGTLDLMKDTIAHEASGVFVRPVDVYTLVRKVEALIGPPNDQLAPALLVPSNRTPVLVASSRKPYRYEGRPSDRAPHTAPGSEAPRAAGVQVELVASAATRGTATRGADARLSNTGTLPGEAAHGAASSASHSPLAEPRASLIPREKIPQSAMSPELSRLLRTAEERLDQTAPQMARPIRLTPDAELEAVLPSDILEALDEPLDFDDDDDVSELAMGTHSGSESGAVTGTGTGSRHTQLGTAPGTHVHESGTNPHEAGTNPGTQSPNDGTQAPLSQPTDMHRPVAAAPLPPTALQATAPPPRPDFEELKATPPSLRRTPVPMPPTSLRAGHGLPQSTRALDPSAKASLLAETRSTIPPPTADKLPPAGSFESRAGGSMRESALPTANAPPPIPNQLHQGDVVRALATVIRSRATGSLAIEDAVGIRRAVFRDGDFVTVASGAESESLVQLLVERGELSAEVAQNLSHRVPPFGRYAGAALIAHGHLRQDELWSALRAHAEWLLLRMVRIESGAASWENVVPGRLQAEPAVFGGATGAEVLVETVRRGVEPARAIARLSGSNAELFAGSEAALLSECALSSEEAELVAQVESQTVGHLIAMAGSADFAAALYALVELGVLSRRSSTPKNDIAEPSASPDALDALDEQALRARIVARRGLVDEGDYFALLGVSRLATGYDVRRAYLELRKQFDPNRPLTTQTVDLRADLELIVEVLDEAYEILKDDVRRERYRRALEAIP